MDSDERPCERLGLDRLRLHAPAKINLTLQVAPRDADGYHPLDSLRRRDDGNITFTCEGLPCGPDERNLAYRAARQLAKVVGRDVPGAEIHLQKRIPPGSGLGGGSSDAAAVLAGLNDLWSLDLPRLVLAEIGAEIGSDVPLFLGPAASRMTGRGERIQPIEVYPFWAVLVLPDLACSTAEVYQAFDADPPAPQPPLDPKLLTQPPSQWRDQLINQLTEAALTICTPLVEVRDALVGALKKPVSVTGSGSGLFCLCDDRDEAKAVWNALPPSLARFGRLARRNPW